MTQPEYEQKKRECWEEFRALDRKSPYSLREVNAFAFDKGYALGKQTETITREDVENAAKKYAAEVDKNVRDLYGIENPPASLTFGECAAESFREGVKFALGKQEKPAEPKFKVGDKVRIVDDLCHEQKYRGEVTEIVYVDKSDPLCPYKVDIYDEEFGGGLWYQESDLEPYTEPERNPQKRNP